MGPMIRKEMKYNLHYGDVRGDVLPPPHGTKKPDLMTEDMNNFFAKQNQVIKCMFKDDKRISL